MEVSNKFGTINDTVERVASGAHEVVDKVAGVAAHMSERAAGVAAQVSEKAADTAAQVAEKFSEKKKELKDVQEDLMETVKVYVNENPVKALAIAAVGGFLLSRILKPR